MSRLFKFLVLLASQEFYGEVRIRFQKGKVHGQVVVESRHVEDALPEPDASDPAYQQAWAEAVQGVGPTAIMPPPLPPLVRPSRGPSPFRA